MLWVEGGKKIQIKRGLKTMETNKVSHERIPSSEMKKRFPMFNFPDDCEGILEHTACSMYASRCLAALQVGLMKRVYFLLSTTLIKMSLCTN